MNIKVVFRGMDHSNSIEEYARNELEDKIFKFLQNEPEPIFFDFIFSAGKPHSKHTAELRLNSKHNHYIVKNEDLDLYLAINHVIKITVAEIKKNKSKYFDKRDHPIKPEIPTDSQ